MYVHICFTVRYSDDRFIYKQHHFLLGNKILSYKYLLIRKMSLKNDNTLTNGENGEQEKYIFNVHDSVKY